MRQLSPLLDDKIAAKMFLLFNQNKKEGGWLYLPKQNLDDTSIPYLCDYLKSNPSIKKLYLANNAIGPGGATFFAQNNKTIEYLNLDKNKIGDSGCDALIKHHDYLHDLHVEQNNINDRGVLNIHLNTRLETLNVGYNSLTDLGAIYLSCSSLKFLWLNANQINELGAYRLEENQNLARVGLTNQRGPKPPSKYLENRLFLLKDRKYVEELTKLLYLYFIANLVEIILQYMDEDIVLRYYEPKSTQAAEPGDTEFKLAMRGNGKGKNVIKNLKQAAEKGHATAQFRLAVHYLEAAEKTEVDKYFELAVDWYLKAAMQGHTDSQYNLAIHFARGTGVKKDDESALFWYKAAQRGHKGAYYKEMFPQISTNPQSFINNLPLNTESSINLLTFKHT